MMSFLTSFFGIVRNVSVLAQWLVVDVSVLCQFLPLNFLTCVLCVLLEALRTPRPFGRVLDFVDRVNGFLQRDFFHFLHLCPQFS